jgi:uncharacterized protein YndB with AHSA1/START domain
VAESVVRVQRHLDALPEDVFGFLTDPARYATWMGRAADLDARPGGVYRVEIDERTVALGEYVSVEPFTRLVFTWGWVGNPMVPPGSTTVEMRLEPDGHGTLLTVHHTGLPADAVGMHREGWDLYTERLAVVVTGAKAPPEPPHP